MAVYFSSKLPGRGHLYHHPRLCGRAAHYPAQCAGSHRLRGYPAFKKLYSRPSRLSGASMEEYEVYAEEGLVLVDSSPCLQLNVYSSTPRQYRAAI